MTDADWLPEATRWLAGALSALLLGVLVAVLLTEGWTRSRLAFFALVAVVALAGIAGVYDRRPVPAAASGAAIVLLGVWQAVLGVIVVPTGLLLVLAAVLARRERPRRRARPSGDCGGRRPTPGQFCDAPDFAQA